MSSEIPEFGERKPGAPYVLRPGGYAVIFDAEGRLAVVANEQCLHLPGGGQEAGETAQEAAVREVAEESGLRVALGPLIGVADELVGARMEEARFRKRCSFFRASVVGAGEPSEPDHELLWMTPDAALARLHHDSQRWAVQKALGLV
jgi:8-oxo-dGTP diphosphatase